MNSIKDELNRLNRNFWIKPLTQLINHYTGFHLDDEHTIKTEILAILQLLDPSDQQLDLNAILKLEALNCFFYRAYITEHDSTLYWNPLTAPYSEFSKQYHHSNIESYQVGTPYPSSDIIRRWFAERFQYKKITQARAEFATAIAQLG